ncbi:MULTISPECIES: COG1470 family protein [Saccharothrix]|uniref:COG1470 family protein n=1 Tax=Saccharothrix TaxID=2071 RepID=UPI00093C2F4A|nr:hydrolytic protein [Saccharothrix sp. CB00851]OKI16161.1 hydrolytic protein [Saccharothrix sp. CB00851]
MTATTEFGLPTVVVTPGQETSTTMTVRNDSDIVEAYEFEVVGACAPWTTVEPARLSLYPGTSEQVAVVLRPPRSPDVRAGEVPLGVRVLPAERPESVVVTETTVIVEPFARQRARLIPKRRRAWRGARYRVEVHNDGNTPTVVTAALPEADDHLKTTVSTAPTTVDPGAHAELELRVRVAKPLWFGKPAVWPVRLDVVALAAEDRHEHELAGELVQLPILSKWLLSLLGALLALLLAWLLLVRPAVLSAAREAADDRAQEIAQAAAEPPTPATQEPGGAPEQQPAGQQGQGQEQGRGTTGGTRQSSGTIEVRTNAGQQGTGTYVVPAGKVFHITDIVLANHQGDEGVLTIAFGERTITVIALETFRNQDYHWVTPIDIPQNGTVTVTVTCARPGTPASGRQAPNCAQLLNVSGELSDLAG